MTFLLDTTVLIDVLRGKQNVRASLDKLVTQGHTLATTSINIGEVYAGVRSGEERKTAELFSVLECYDITSGIGRHAGTLKNEYARSGKTLSLVDMIIAATALEHGLVLVTDNRKDFPLSVLQFHDTR